VFAAGTAEIRAAAEAMRDAVSASTPIERASGEWHLPYITDDDRVEAVTRTRRCGASPRPAVVECRISPKTGDATWTKI